MSMSISESRIHFYFIFPGVYEEELTEETCPICEKDYPPEQLPIHAQTCAQQWFD